MKQSGAELLVPVVAAHGLWHNSESVLGSCNTCRDGRHQGKVGIVDATKNVLNVLNSEHGATDGSVIKTKAWTMLTADGHPSTWTSITDKLVKRLPFHCRGRKLSLPSEFGNQRIPVITDGTRGMPSDPSHNILHAFRLKSA